jgi:hypothetical protein
VGELVAARLRDCLGGDSIVEVTLPRTLQASDIERVEGAVTRVVLADLPRPFFRVDVPGRYLITGILSEARVRFTVRRALRDCAERVALDGARQLLGS